MSPGESRRCPVGMPTRSRPEPSEAGACRVRYRVDGRWVAGTPRREAGHCAPAPKGWNVAAGGRGGLDGEPALSAVTSEGRERS